LEEFSASNKPGAQNILSVSTCWRVDTPCHIMYYLVEFKTMNKQVFIYTSD